MHPYSLANISTYHIYLLPLFVNFVSRSVSCQLPFFCRYSHTPCVTAKLARNVPTILFSYAAPFFFCTNAPLGTQHKAPTSSFFVWHVGKPGRINYCFGIMQNPVGLLPPSKPGRFTLRRFTPTGFYQPCQHLLFLPVRSIPIVQTRSVLDQLVLCINRPGLAPGSHAVPIGPAIRFPPKLAQVSQPNGRALSLRHQLLRWCGHTLLHLHFRNWLFCPMVPCVHNPFPTGSFHAFFYTDRDCFRCIFHVF